MSSRDRWWCAHPRRIDRILPALALIVLFSVAPASADSPPAWYGTGTFASAPGRIVDM